MISSMLGGVALPGKSPSYSPPPEEKAVSESKNKSTTPHTTQRSAWDSPKAGEGKASSYNVVGDGDESAARNVKFKDSEGSFARENGRRSANNNNSRMSSS